MALLNALLVFLVGVFVAEISTRMSVLLASCIYVAVWLWNPSGWYRRTFLAFNTAWFATTIGSFRVDVFSQVHGSINTLKAEIQNDWIVHICYTAVMLALLCFDYLSRKEK